MQVVAVNVHVLAVLVAAPVVAGADQDVLVILLEFGDTDDVHTDVTFLSQLDIIGAVRHTQGIVIGVEVAGKYQSIGDVIDLVTHTPFLADAVHDRVGVTPDGFQARLIGVLDVGVTLDVVLFTHIGFKDFDLMSVDHVGDGGHDGARVGDVDDLIVGAHHVVQVTDFPSARFNQVIVTRHIKALHTFLIRTVGGI